MPYFFFNDTATTEIYTLSLHDALPISRSRRTPTTTSAWQVCSSSSTAAPWGWRTPRRRTPPPGTPARSRTAPTPSRSEEHTSELQSHVNLVCRLLLEKKKIPYTDFTTR